MNEEQRLEWISRTLKDFRQSRGLSLDDLSKSSGVSRSMICQLEACQTNPTVSVLGKLAGAMELKLADLVDPGEKAKVYRLQSLSEARKKSTSPDGSFICSLLSEGSSNRHLEVYAFEFSKKGSFQSKGHGPKALEYLFVSDGELELDTNHENLKLSAGDLIEFRASGTHTYRQTSKNFAKGLSIIFFGL